VEEIEINCEAIEKKILALVKDVESQAKWVENYIIKIKETEKKKKLGLKMELNEELNLPYMKNEKERHEISLNQAKGTIELLLKDLKNCELKNLYGVK